jgi:protease PrsW
MGTWDFKSWVNCIKIEINRDGQISGPYPVQLVTQYLEEGKLLPQDLARVGGRSSGEWKALSRLLADEGVSTKRREIKDALREVRNDLKSIDLNLILPWREITSVRVFKNRRLLYLALVGLAPAIALSIAPGASLGYWAIAFYFSGLWSLFFYYLFKTSQVKTKQCFLCFFFTAFISVAVLMLIQNIPPWTALYAMADSDVFLVKALGMFFGVGIHEELCKAAILFVLVTRPGNLLIPQTVVFYGLMSGLGFGIYEGVSYQQTVNKTQGIDMAYFLNIARLTSLPFIHAIWTAIAGYFIAFAALYPAKRYGLWLLAITIPAFFHAVYNTFGWGIIGLGSAFLSVVLLMTYLSNCSELQKSLKTQ